MASLRTIILADIPIIVVVVILVKLGYLPVLEFESVFINSIAKIGIMLVYLKIIFYYFAWVFSLSCKDKKK